jgi:hypothetical protein
MTGPGLGDLRSARSTDPGNSRVTAFLAEHWTAEKSRRSPFSEPPACRAWLSSGPRGVGLAFLVAGTMTSAPQVRYLAGRSSKLVTPAATFNPVCVCTLSGCSVKVSLDPPTSRLAPPPTTTVASAPTPV